MERQFAFNENVLNYEKFRPTYPKEVYEDILKYSNLCAGCNTLEIGIGTGQATVSFLDLGCFVTAVELGKNLAEFSANKFQSNKNFSIINDDFITANLLQNSYDLVYCATAFHWLPQEEAFKKVINILKPKGTLALFWNHAFPNKNNDKSNIINKQIYNKFLPNNEESVEFTQEDCHNYINLLTINGFNNIKCKLYSRVRTLTSIEYIGLLNTYSEHILLPQNLKDSIENSLKTQLDTADGTINIYDTIDLYLAQKP